MNHAAPARRTPNCSTTLSDDSRTAARNCSPAFTTNGVGGRVELEKRDHRGQAQRIVPAQDLGSPRLEAARANGELDQIEPWRGVLGR